MCAQGQFEQGVELLRIALQLDDRTGVRQVLRDLLVTRAQENLDTDWRAVEALADRALEIDANHALARSLRAQALDRKREEEVPLLASQARRLQAAGDFAGALAEVEKGLAAYPGDARLSAIVEALRKELKRAPPAPPAAIATGAAVASAATPPKPDAASPATDVERTRLVPERRASPPAPSQPPAAVQPDPKHDAGAPRPLPWKLIAGAGAAATIVVVGVAVVLLRQGATTQSESPAPEAQQTAPPSPPTTPTPEPLPETPALVALTLEELPPGLHVSLDGASIGIVGEDGRLSYPGVTPGPHTLSFQMDGYEPLTIERTFSDAAVFTLSATDVPLKATSGSLELTADGGTRMTVSQNGRLVQRVTGSSKLSIPEGTYDIEATGPAGVAVKRSIAVTAGGKQTLDVRRMIVTGMEQFDLSAWKRDEDWFTRRGGGFALYNRPSTDGRFTFTVRLDRDGNPFSSGSRLKWVVGYVDNNTHVMLQLDKDAFYRADVVGGQSQPVRVAHRIPTNVPFVHLNVQLSGARLIHQYSVDGTNWQTLDSWTRTPRPSEKPRRTPFDGRFGLFLAGDEEVFVSNFLHYPESR